MGYMKELVAIQEKLKAPKDANNDFGHYKYRSCEQILEKVKPLLKEQNCQLVLTDTLEELAGRVYVKAKATITNKDGQQESAEAHAREAETKKGMDDSQITGTSTSYARKYALGGLFLIDDTKDADTNEYAEKVKQAEEKEKQDAEIEALGNEKIRDIDLKVLEQMLTDAEADIDKFMENYRIKDLKDMTVKDYADAVKKLQKKIDKKGDL